MCGIVGFTGNRQAAPILLDGLSKLEYRGYDSAGLAVRDGEALAQVVKAKGRLSNLIEKTDNGNALKGTCGIGHTRWATHGEPSQTNAHPHVSGNKSQNRIIACHGVGSDLRMYVQQSDFTIHSTSEHLDKILMADESCDYFYKIRIPQQIRKQLLVQLDAMGFHESSIYPDMEHIAKEQATSHFNF